MNSFLHRTEVVGPGVKDNAFSRLVKGYILVSTGDEKIDLEIDAIYQEADKKTAELMAVKFGRS